jgi:hypothetical protein
LVARLRLDRASRDLGAIIVEGPTDGTVLGRAYRIDKRQMFPVGGRANVIRCAQRIHDCGLGGVICVADRDFEPAEEAYAELWLLLFYDDADLEAMLICTDLLDRLLAEWGSARKTQSAGGAEHVRKRLFECVAPLSALRHANAVRGLGLPLDALPLHDLIDKTTLEMDIRRVVMRLAAKTGRSNEMLTQAAGSGQPACPHSGRALARGRDLATALEVGLRQLLGNLNKQQVEGRLVERSLRSMVGSGDLPSSFGMRFHAAFGRAVPAKRAPGT